MESYSPKENSLLDSLNWKDCASLRAKAVRDLYVSSLSSDKPVSVYDLIPYFIKQAMTVEYFVHQRHYIDGLGGDFAVAHMASKRGNDVHAWRQKNSIQPLFDFVHDNNVEFFKDDDDSSFYDERTSTKTSPVLFITLTYDPSIASLLDAWKNIGRDLNRFLTALRNKYGEIAQVRAFEAFKSGYPHVHLLVYFKEHSFTTFKHKSFHGGKVNVSFRVPNRDRKAIQSMYHSNVDIKVMKSLKEGVRYVYKYTLKSLTAIKDLPDTADSRKILLTQTLLWVFGKRSFHTGGEFLKAIKAHRQQEQSLRTSVNEQSRSRLEQSMHYSIPSPIQEAISKGKIKIAMEPVHYDIIQGEISTPRPYINIPLGSYGVEIASAFLPSDDPSSWRHTHLNLKALPEKIRDAINSRLDSAIHSAPFLPTNRLPPMLTCSLCLEEIQNDVPLSLPSDSLPPVPFKRCNDCSFDTLFHYDSCLRCGSSSLQILTGNPPSRVVKKRPFKTYLLSVMEAHKKSHL